MSTRASCRNCHLGETSASDGEHAAADVVGHQVASAEAEAVTQRVRLCTMVFKISQAAFPPKLVVGKWVGLRPHRGDIAFEEVGATAETRRNGGSRLAPPTQPGRARVNERQRSPVGHGHRVRPPRRRIVDCDAGIISCRPPARAGYRDDIVIDGVPLLDRVWLAAELPDGS